MDDHQFVVTLHVLLTLTVQIDLQKGFISQVVLIVVRTVRTGTTTVLQSML